MKLTSTFITTVLFSSISIAAAIDPQVAAGTTVVVAEVSPDSPASGSSLAERSAAFNEEDFKFDVKEFRKYMDFSSSNRFNNENARPMAEDFIERLGNLKRRLGDRTISETLTEEMKLLQFKVDMVEEVAHDIETYAARNSIDFRNVYDLIRARMEVLYLQTSPYVYDLDILKQGPDGHMSDELQRYAFIAWKLVDQSIRSFLGFKDVSQERKNVFYDMLVKTKSIIDPFLNQFPNLENTKSMNSLLIPYI